MSETEGRKEKLSGIKGMAVSVAVILFFVGIIVVYYIMLYRSTEENIIAGGRINALNSMEQIDSHLSTSINVIKIAGYTLDNMIRDKRSDEEILDYLANQTIAVQSALIDDTTGLYGYINGKFLDGSGWVPGDDYVPTERPWYIKAKAGSGRVSVVDPYVDMDTGSITITLTKMLCDAKSVVGIDISMDKLQSITEEHADTNGVYTEMIIDGKGRIIAHSDKTHVATEEGKRSALDDVIISNVSFGSEHYFHLKHDAREYIVYEMPLQSGWTFLSVTDATDQYDKLSVPLTITVFTAVLLISVLLFLMITSDRNIKEAKLFADRSERAVAESKAKSAFLSNMSHEIRTPINAILGMNEMIQRECEDEEVLKYSDSIRSAGATLLNLVNDILDFSRIESGKMEIIPVSYSPAAMCADLVDMIRPRAAEKGLELITNIPQDIPSALRGDELRIRQIITNILTNAVKYTEKGSIVFTVSLEETIPLSDDMMMNVSVKDTGIGIRRDDMEKLLSEFVRVDEKRNRNIEGTGLGLAITDNLLRMMGSRLKVESTYGEGSVFGFSLRQEVLNRIPAGDLRTALPAGENRRIGSGESFVAPTAIVLVVDDTPLNLEVFESLLKRTQVQINTATNADDAVALARSRKYDVIFMDHMMPGKDGIEALNEIRGDAEGLNISTPVICLTANAISGAKEEYINEGFDEYLSKPVSPATLEEMLSRFLPAGKVRITKVDERKMTEGREALPQFVRLIDEIDIEEGLVNCGETGAYLRTLKMFAKMFPALGAEAKGYVESGDLENAVIKIHAMKSSLKVIGAYPLGEEARMLEEAGKGGNLEEVKSGFGSLYDSSLKLAEKLMPLTDTETTDDQAKPEIGKDELDGIFKRICSELSEWNTDAAIAEIEKLDSFRIPDDKKEIVEKIKDAADGFEYEKITLILTQDISGEDEGR